MPGPGKHSARRIAKADIGFARQVMVVTRIGLSTLRQRLKGAAVVIVSFTVVTLVMFPGLIIADALQRGDEEQGRADRAVVTSVGARWDFNSLIPANWVAAIRAAPGIARDAKGALLADAQTDLLCLGGMGHPRVGSGTCIHLIGMEPAGHAMRTDIALVAGHWPRPGQRELMAGIRAAHVYDRLAVGKHLQLRGDFAWGAKSVASNDWRVVGTFASNSLFDAEAVAPADMVRAAIGRGDASTIMVQLTSAATFDRFRQAIAANPALHVTVERQTDYYRRVGHTQTRAAIIVEMLIGTLLGLGAMAGVMHTMQVTIETREGEIAVLRAIGFDGVAAAASVVLEAMLLALAGALLGIAILWLWLDGRMLAGALPLGVNFSLAIRAVAWACGIALLGAIMPALGAVRMDVAEALRR
jgi:putative ABC transport system permease protein